MYDILKKIFDTKLKEVALLKAEHPSLDKYIEKRLHNRDKSLQYALKNRDLSVIAEIKRHSPSRGNLATISDPVALANKYIHGGANAISILTDKEFFHGSTSDLELVSNSIKNSKCPILRKDFIVDPYQIYESIKIGADAILLIVNVLMNKTAEFLKIANKLNIEALVEVHTKEELDIAISSGAKIIGINNRDLNTFKVDINNSIELHQYIPKDVISISESGMTSIENVKKVRVTGFDAVLIGEFLVSSDNPTKLISEMRSI